MLPTVSGQFVQMVVQGCHNPHVQQIRSSRCRRLRHLIRHNFFPQCIASEIQAVHSAYLDSIIFNNSIALTLVTVHFVLLMYSF